MDIERVIKAADKLFRKYKLNIEGWKFKLNRNRATIGLCLQNGKEKTIFLSEHFIRDNEEAIVIDVLLHEIAHAIVGPQHGHSKAWQSKCVELGCEPSRLISGASVLYTAIQACPCCNLVLTAGFKKTKKIICIQCDCFGEYVPAQKDVEIGLLYKKE